MPLSFDSKQQSSFDALAAFLNEATSNPAKYYLSGAKLGGPGSVTKVMISNTLRYFNIGCAPANKPGCYWVNLLVIDTVGTGKGKQVAQGGYVYTLKELVNKMDELTGGNTLPQTLETLALKYDTANSASGKTQATTNSNNSNQVFSIDDPIGDGDDFTEEELDLMFDALLIHSSSMVQKSVAKSALKKLWDMGIGRNAANIDDRIFYMNKAFE